MEPKKPPEWREALKGFRERMGGLTEARKAYAKADRETRKAVREALRAGAKTVPAIAAETGVPSQDVLWHLMALRRYGELAEAGRAGDYFLYALKERER
ncbi:MAG: hypothetical protein ACE147_12020 [Candidatus Methylomirabilales bacterium]